MARSFIDVNHFLQASSGFLITSPKPSPSISCSVRPLPGKGLTKERRSANYHPSVWDFDFIQSLKSDYKGSKKHENQAKKLEDGVRNRLKDEMMMELAQLELIDALQRMGLRHKFEKEIEIILEKIATCYENATSQSGTKEDLHTIALRFRLLRQHGHLISSQDTFKFFEDQCGNFEESLCKDVEGMLSLYEASFYALETGDDILDKAKIFTTRHLKGINSQIEDLKLVKLVSHSLELPLHWRMLSLEARWYTEACCIEEDSHTNRELIKLAKLNFNMVQTIYQEELKELSGWWNNLGLTCHPELTFARDRLVECFAWGESISVHPQESYCRKQVSKVGQLVALIDDVYDVYGSLDELELFTDAIERWDMDAMKLLPNYMKICFLTVFNFVNEMVFNALKEKDLDISHYLKRAWTDICKAYLTEAKWYYNKYTPTLQEYLDNGWISTGGPILLIHCYTSLNHEIKMEVLDSIQGDAANIVRWSSMILRLLDDLGTSKHELERGDVSKSIQCYMHETGEYEEAAREHVKHLIEVCWKKLNKELTDRNSIFSNAFIKSAAGLSRISHRFYKDELDGFAISDGATKETLFSLVVEPMSLEE